MTILTKRLPYLNSLGLADDAETIRRVRGFMLQTGLTLGDMADLANLNPSSLRVYVSGHYSKRTPDSGTNSLGIRASLKEVMDIHEVSQAQLPGGTHYKTSEYEAVRESMWSALRGGTAFLVDGPPGTQKTYTFRRVADEINAAGEGRAVYVYARVEQGPQSFLIEACTRAGIPNRGTIDQLIRKLRFFLGSKRALLIVDETQHLGLSGMEVLRQLLDEARFGVGLGGSHDVSKRLAHWQMEQWRSRVRRTHMLNGLTPKEAGQILRAELGVMDSTDIRDSIADATVQAVRDNKPFKYISARNLFFAIQDARNAINASSTPSPIHEEATV